MRANTCGCGLRVAAGEASARIGPKLFTVLRKVRAEHLAGLVGAVEGDAALLDELLGIAQQERKIGVCTLGIRIRTEAFIGRGKFFRGQHAHHGVAGHGAQQAVRVEVALGGAFAEGHRHQRHQIVRPFRPRAEG
jgi:hypothetical protein